MLPITERIALKEVPFLLESRNKISTQDRVHQQSTVIDENPLLQKRIIRSARGMRRYLIQEEGVEYVPRSRLLTVPQRELAAHSVYARYLRKSSFFDRFEFDHGGRKAWHKQLEQKINPDLVSAVCINDNQLTLNSISAILLFSAYLIRSYGRQDQRLADSLEIQQAKLQMLYQGPLPSDEILEKIREEQNLETTAQVLAVYAKKRYGNLSFQDKLSIVHGFCTAIAESLWIIARSESEQPEATQIRVTGNRRRRKGMSAQL